MGLYGNFWSAYNSRDAAALSRVHFEPFQEVFGWRPGVKQHGLAP